MVRRQGRGVSLIAVLAIGVALVCLLAAQGQVGHGADLAAILPLLVVGMISPLLLLGRLEFAYVGPAPETPVMPARFERPPPSLLG